MKKITNKKIAEMLKMDIQVFYRLKRKYPLLFELVKKGLKDENHKN